MTDCIFCKIIKGEVPSSKIYEDDNVYAFLDISPVNPGHTLVVPKQHCTDLYEMTNDEINAVFTTAKRIAKAVVRGVQADGVNIGMNNGKAAGQIVFHAHIHVIPRFMNDGYHHWHGKPYEGGQQAEVAKRIVTNLK
ncbi:HIT family protein [Candidatus Woesearchaeota archaeon]|nr:HIT family protein [Candidatus Woesearchaeota archaeon]